MAQAQTKFVPAENGFPFVNRFEFKLPLKFTLPLAGTIDLNEVVLGLCGGMCFAALDNFYAGKAPTAAASPQELDPKTLIYLADRQIDSLKITTLIKFIEWMLIDQAEIGARMLRSEIPRLRRMLDKGDPAVLGLVRVQGLGDPTHNHQVLAVAYSLDDATREMQISLYDPNHPGQTPTLRLNLGQTGPGFAVTQSTGEALRGFFIIPYQAKVNAFRLAPRGAALAPRGPMAAIRLAWPVDSRRVNQFFGENPDSYKPFGLPGHEGLDLFAPTGANVYAAAPGVVEKAGHPAGHPYGLQVRLRHEMDGVVFHTIYAHLSETRVQENDLVSAGDLLGLADNTGNSFGSHLHLTLKIDGAQTPGYPAGIVDPWPYLQNPVEVPPPGPLPPKSGVTVFTTSELNLRAGPNTGAQVVAGLPAGEPLSTLGDAAAVKAKIGQQGEWLQVQTASGQAGFVAAWFVQGFDQSFPPSSLVIYPADALNLRSGPGTGFDVLAALAPTDPLTVLGDADNARAKIGRQGEWIQVQTEAGQRGFVAAWLVHLTGQAPQASGLSVFPTVPLNVRARPGAEENVLTVVLPGDALAVLGDKTQALARIGRQGEWLNVRTPQKYTGYVAAWLVSADAGAPPAPPAGLGELTLFTTADVNMRAQASANSPRVGGILRGGKLRVIETDLDAARAKTGRQGLWVFGESEEGTRGWVAAWFLSTSPLT